jgi:hypothetical protein
MASRFYVAQELPNRRCELGDMEISVGLPIAHLYMRSVCNTMGPQHHEHKGDPGVTPGTCGAIGERDQVILVWVTLEENLSIST